jgi:hypothetical protein
MGQGGTGGCNPARFTGIPAELMDRMDAQHAQVNVASIAFTGRRRAGRGRRAW